MQLLKSINAVCDENLMNLASESGIIARAMGPPGIDRKLIRIAAIISIPLELVALFGLYTFLLDATYFSGRSQWWVAYGMVGFYVHFLGVLLIGSKHTPGGTDLLIIPFLGYANVFFQVILVALGFRVIRELCSTRCTNYRHQHRRIEPDNRQVSVTSSNT